MKFIKQQIKNLTLLPFLMVSILNYSQNQGVSSTFTYNSFSLSPITSFLLYGDSYGAGIEGELSYSSGKDIFTLSLFYGEASNWLGLRGAKFQQLNFYYGREFEVVKKCFIDTYGGAGVFFKQKGSDHFFNANDENSVVKLVIPLALKFRYKIGKKFSMGLKFQSNLNSYESMHSFGLILQWNR